MPTWLTVSLATIAVLALFRLYDRREVSPGLTPLDGMSMRRLPVLPDPRAWPTKP
jgi:hypothetical protein